MGQRFKRRALCIGLLPVLLAATELALASVAVPSMLPLLGLLFCAVGLFYVPIAAYRAWRLMEGRAAAAAGIGLAILMTVGAMAAMRYLSWPLRRLAFARAAQRAQPLVDAIRAFERSKGRPPDALQELVPNHLAAVPATGLVSYPSYEYTQFKDASASFVWWDLGSRRGAQMTGPWVYPDGDPGHAVLGIELDGDELVREVRLDRMPQEGKEQPFSPDAWLSQPDRRLYMVRDLAESNDLRTMSREALEQILGPPTGRRVLRDSPWELRIPCALGILNWDVFFYWPTERYPEQLYDGGIERIGHWAYVHE